MNKLTAVIIIALILGFASHSFAGDTKYNAVTGNFYFDIATGHKYIKNPGTDTYREYSQRGKLLKDEVSNSIPLLATNKYIREMNRDHYLLYQKVNYQRKELMVLSADHDHPNGWTCKKLLFAMDGLFESIQAQNGHLHGIRLSQTVRALALAVSFQKWSNHLPLHLGYIMFGEGSTYQPKNKDFGGTFYTSSLGYHNEKDFQEELFEQVIEIAFETLENLKH